VEAAGDADTETVEAGVGQHLVERGVDRRMAVLLGIRLGALRDNIADGDEGGILREGADRLGVRVADDSAAHDAEFHDSGHGSFLLSGLLSDIRVTGADEVFPAGTGRKRNGYGFCPG
jgi:hypothetical protein